MDQEELSEAVRQENASSTRIGVGRSSKLGFNAIFVSGSTSVSSNFNLESEPTGGPAADPSGPTTTVRETVERDP